MQKDYRELQRKFVKTNHDGIKLLMVPYIETKIKELPGFWVWLNTIWNAFIIAFLLIAGIAMVLVSVITWSLNPDDVQIWQKVLPFVAVAFFIIAVVLFILRVVLRNKIVQYLSNVLDKTLIYKKIFNNFTGFRYFGTKNSDFRELSKIRHTGEFEIPENGLINSRTNQLMLDYHGSNVIFQTQSYTWNNKEQAATGKPSDLIPKEVIGLIQYDTVTSEKATPYKDLVFTLRSKSSRFEKLRSFESGDGEFDRYFFVKTNDPVRLKSILTPDVQDRLLNLAKSGIKAKKWSFEKINNLTSIKFVPFIDYSPAYNFSFENKANKIANNFATTMLTEIFQIYLLMRLPIDAGII